MAAAATDLLQEVGIASATTLDSPGYTIGDTSITVVSVSTWPTATGITFAMDQVDAAGVQVAGTYNEYVGVKASATSITNVSHQNGTNQNYTAGATTRVYIPVSAERENRIVEWGLQDHTQLGYHETLTDTNGNEWIKQTATTSAVNEVTVANAATTNGPTISATGDDTNIDLVIKPKGTGKLKPGFLDGWSYNTLPAVSSVTNNGNRSYDVTFASTVASYLTPGMRVRTSRTVAAPTQCTSLNGTTQYYSKATPNKLTFTDDFVVSAWIYLTSYASGSIASRYDGTSGWDFGINSNGQLDLRGFNAGAANVSAVDSYQSIPLNKWVHVAAQLDMSTFTATTTTSYTMIDGVDVPATVSRSGTNPTTLVQAGNLNIGARNGGLQPFPGKIAQVAIYNAKVTQANIRATIGQTLSGSETSLASAYSFNNSIADLNTTNANDLTAQGSAVATNADSPFSLDANGTPGGTYDYGIVTKVATTVATVQVPEGCAIPTSGGVSAVDLSAYKSPYGFPAQRDRWNILLQLLSSVSTSGTSVNTTYNPGGLNLNVPVGNWNLTFESQVTVIPTATTPDLYSTLSTSSSAFTIGSRFNVRHYIAQQSGSGTHLLSSTRSDDVSVSSATPYYILLRTPNAFSSMTVRGDIASGVGETTSIVATPAHL